ncbi:MAG: RdgB/HAM1 family non-canonical purine NTP pyrophosphatase [Gammaproteobacteria bacterium]|nr:RdgB/HAM1 family non-canonical purine NTP pyrophosphatase [Gammaproteobacteria bacterium]MBU1555360.1 RdgB/HAM1 family non-canonical purine NTP pyrophosphatase [Gammaproteobacteria bacterium]MBU2069858.1 RdgB/HAM1 family non-canonical purine NTP pyrophosphatase [Gammaproteobacteria bacterium]MBU2184860.1 RdgB/HAM1 family non-canonical purine NTP pyrophosphatase [Gammaproteobacteria bacterium]MBU2204396.1 RdgB/HAM1 family non-canonical purine NTP pyrophosphatase [Gammaproteobacteria bacterium
MTNNIVLASGNKGKVTELSQMLAPFKLQVIPQTELGVSDADETGLTFIENAIIKARHAALATGLPAIADDSGLAVDALDGAPGIYSARYAGEAASDSANIDKLLLALKDVPAGQRGAQFHCVLVYLRHAEDPTPLVCHGVWHGSITQQRAGCAGFGYDPVFYVATEGCTSAELSRERKQQLSHRGKALAQLLNLLQQSKA